jgi:hypothetical protein
MVLCVRVSDERGDGEGASSEELSQIHVDTFSAEGIFLTQRTFFVFLLCFIS